VEDQRTVASTIEWTNRCLPPLAIQILAGEGSLGAIIGRRLGVSGHDSESAALDVSSEAVAEQSE